MLSLNKLTTLVQVRDNVYPVTVHHEIEISDEDLNQEEPDETNQEMVNDVGIAMLLKMAKRHKSASRVKPEKYYPAWCQSMRQLINDNGMEELNFLELCLRV